MPTFSTLQLNRNEFSRAHVRQPSTVWNEKKEESIVYSASRTVYLLLFISALFILFFSSFNRFSLRHFSFILVFIFFFFVSLCVFCLRILWNVCECVAGKFFGQSVFFCLSFVQISESINSLCAFNGPKMMWKKKKRRTNLHETF